MLDEKHVAATIKNRLPGWQVDAVQFINELLKEREELLAGTKKVEVVEKIVEVPAPVAEIVELKEDEQVKVETAAVVEKKPIPKKTPKKKSFFGRSKD